MKIRITYALQVGLLSLLTTSASVAQQPTVAAALNSASSILPGLPGSDLAQGSIIVVYGSNLGPTPLREASGFPLPTTLGGTSASISVNGTTLSMPMFYTTATQIAAILPSKTPIGTGTITVTYNGLTSGTLKVNVVASAFGTYAVNGQGFGAAVATFADYSVIAPTHPAHNGDEIVFWGTGLGPITGNDGAAADPGNLANVNLQAFIGGQTATIGYHGRSGCCAGLDQVVVTVPENISGCAVPAVFQVGSEISNYTNIAVAAPGQDACMDPVTNIGGTTLTSLFSKGAVNIGEVFLFSETSSVPDPLTGANTTQTTEDGFASFSKITIPAGSTSVPSSFSSSVSLGACTVTTITETGSTTTNPDPGFKLTSLDAGPAITINGPNGTQTLTKTSEAGFIDYLISGSSGFGNYLTAGNYTAAGTGGTDVGAFTTSLTLPQPLDWTNQSSIATVNRSAGQLITWTGGDPSGTVTISGSSILVNAASSTTITTFTCIVPTGAGSFTISPTVLLSLAPSTQPANSGFISGSGSLEVQGYTKYGTFTAPGLDIGLIFSSSGAESLVTYQ